MIRVLEPNKDYIIRADKNGIVDDVIEYKHGYWIDINENGSLWECSICGDRSCCCGNYCMECGAKMDEVTDGIKQI